MAKDAPVTKGCVVEVAEKGKFYLAIVLEQDQRGGRSLVLLDNGKELSISHKQITHYLPMQLECTWPSANLVNELRSLGLRAQASVSQCDVSLLWTLMHEEERSNITMDEACDFFFSQAHIIHKLATIYALRQDDCYFKALSPAQLSVRSHAYVADKIAQQHIIQQRESFCQEFASQASAILTLPKSERAPALQSTLESPAARDAWAMIEDYALHTQTDSKYKNEAEKLLSILQSTSKLNLPGSAHFRARAFLWESCYWDANTRVALKKYNIPIDFEPDVQEYAQSLATTPVDASHRHDLRHLSVFSIDDPDTMEIDDALSVETLPHNMRRLGVHIAAPAALVEFASPIEIAARHRASSLYLPHTSITMLPTILAHDKASLNPLCTRYALSFLFTFDAEGVCTHEEILPSIVESKHRLSYDEVEDLLEFSSTKLAEDLRSINEIAEYLIQNRLSRGAIEIDSPESKLSQNPQTGHITLHPIDTTMMSRTMVAECMILANATAARFCAKHQLRVLYRSQEPPVNFPSQRELDSLPNDTLRSLAMRRSMMPAVCTYAPLAHSSLGVEEYLQVTSPLRRYADFFAHYQMESYLLHQASVVPDQEAECILSASEIALANVKAAMAECRHEALLEYLKQELDSTLQATLLSYASDNSLIAHVLLDETQLRATLSTRKRYPLGSTLLVQVDQIKPQEQYFSLKLID